MDPFVCTLLAHAILPADLKEGPIPQTPQLPSRSSEQPLGHSCYCPWEGWEKALAKPESPTQGSQQPQVSAKHNNHGQAQQANQLSVNTGQPLTYLQRSATDIESMALLLQRKSIKRPCMPKGQRMSALTSAT